MKGYNKWSYAPYRPLMWDVGDIYICRIAPYPNRIHFEWLNTDEAEYSVFYRKRDEGEFILAGKTEGTEFDIVDLQIDTDYEFYVCTDDKKSRVRLARCGESVGVTVNYLHPDDKAYAFSGHSLCSPSLLKHPDGYLLASMDVFKGMAPQNLTLIFRSDDNGESWHYVSELMPCFWGELFIHKGDIYMLATSTEYGDLLISKSTDGGKSFSAPVALLRGSNGKDGNSGVHKYPQHAVSFGGRIWRTMEWGAWACEEYRHAAMVISYDENADPLNPESWHFSEPLKYDMTWNGIEPVDVGGTLEGALAITPNGELYNYMRYCTSARKILAYKVNTDDPDAPLEYSHPVEYPGNHTKFMIQRDEQTGLYYSIACRRLDEPKTIRNLLSLMVSKDLLTWELVTDLLDYRHEDAEKIGFQYVAFEIDGDDIIYLSRTAINDAFNFHDTNYSTFHRIKNFRDL